LPVGCRASQRCDRPRTSRGRPVRLLLLVRRVKVFSRGPAESLHRSALSRAVSLALVFPPGR
jgi:hypothetical protein